MLTVSGLTKRFGATQAVAGVDLAISGGEIFGLLGANGAGKTSLVEAIAGLAEPDSGTITIAGIDARADRSAARRACGLALQSTGLPPRLSVRETLALFAALHRTDPGDLMARFGLAEKADARTETLSGGQRQRLALALAFLGDPPLVILDEPTAGLDPAIRADVHALIRSLRAAGRAILITTHDMAEAMHLCDRVAVMAAGRIVAEGPPRDLIYNAGALTRIHVQTTPELPRFLAESLGATTQTPAGTAFAPAEIAPFLARLAAEITANRIAITAITTETATLDDLIIAIARTENG